MLTPDSTKPRQATLASALHPAVAGASAAVSLADSTPAGVGRAGEQAVKEDTQQFPHHGKVVPCLPYSRFIPQISPPAYPAFA